MHTKPTLLVDHRLHQLLYLSRKRHGSKLDAFRQAPVTIICLVFRRIACGRILHRPTFRRLRIGRLDAVINLVERGKRLKALPLRHNDVVITE